jgi:hypothetical protein
MRELPLVLQLDIAGNPQCWVDYEKSAYYYAKGLVAWEAAPINFTLYGGKSRMTGEQSTLTMNTIIAVRGKMSEKQLKYMNRVPLSNKALFRRDRNVCAYCGNEFRTDDLSRDHIVPSSRGGPNTWMNVVTACSNCNKHKDNKTPEEAGMQLLYVPYVPNRSEYLILQNKRVLQDQMEFLMKRVPKESRLHPHN